MHQVTARYAHTGTTARPAAAAGPRRSRQHPAASLAELVSTLSGLGVQIVTAWQSVAQIEAAYGRATGATVIANHRTKVFFSGISDGVTGDLTSKLLGDEQVLYRQVSSEIGIDSGRRSLLEASDHDRARSRPRAARAAHRVGADDPRHDPARPPHHPHPVRRR